MNLKEIQNKLYEKLEPSGWGRQLKMFLLSDEFYKILKTLYTDSQNKKRFTPTLKDVFKAFEECPYDELKVIIVGQDPYPRAGVADGIAFSCSNTEKVEKELKFFYEELERTFEVIVEKNPDLKYISNQGVLMLNTALTCEVSKVGTHIDLWKPFMINLFDQLGTYNTGLVYIFLGQKAKEWSKHVPNSNYKFFAPHPVVAAYGKGYWNTGGLFKNVNKILKNNYDIEINWYEKELPF